MMVFDPLLARADKIVEILDLKQQPQFSNPEAQITLGLVLRGLMKPFMPELVVTGKKDNVIHVDFR